MTKIPIILLAAVIGVITEITLCVISVVMALLGGVGPCGPSGEVPGFIQAIHQPGFWLAKSLVGDSSLSYLVLAVSFTTAFLSILAFVVLRLSRGEIKQPDVDDKSALNR